VRLQTADSLFRFSRYRASREHFTLAARPMRPRLMPLQQAMRLLPQNAYSLRNHWRADPRLGTARELLDAGVPRVADQVIQAVMGGFGVFGTCTDFAVIRRREPTRSVDVAMFCDWLQKIGMHRDDVLASYHLRGWKSQAISTTMETAGMTISRNATMLTAMPRTRKASAASTAIITTTATAQMTRARHPVMTMAFPSESSAS
jgi:hypothetical protein